MFHAKFLLFLTIATLATAEYKIDPRIVQGHDAIRGIIVPKIVDGHNAMRGQFPFFVFLQIRLLDGTADCGGSLINNEWIITAAHCLQDALFVRAHLGFLHIADESEPGRKIFEIYISGMHAHPDFSQKTISNDIALLKLPDPVEFDDVIRPISFACSASDGMDVIAIGNGDTSDNASDMTLILQYTELKTTDLQTCVKNYPFLLSRKSVVCAVGEGHKSVCAGDSGGPLVTPDNNSLIGLVSFGSKKGCELGLPQVFTRISSYNNWIKKVSGVECKN